MKVFSFVICLFFVVGTSRSQTGQKRVIPLTTTDHLTLLNVQAESVQLQGKSGLRIAKSPDYTTGETLVILTDVRFKNGTIELELTGEPAVDAEPAMRGFVGVAFRLTEGDPNRYECFYLRPTNARADNQLRRNHTTQYVSHPEFPWHRLRQESPGAYESYVDVVPGEWIKVKIEVANTKARLYVNDSDQPSLIVNDLKHGEHEGSIGLWLHSSTVAHFRNLVVTPLPDY